MNLKNKIQHSKLLQEPKMSRIKEESVPTRRSPRKQDSNSPKESAVHFSIHHRQNYRTLGYPVRGMIEAEKTLLYICSSFSASHIHPDRYCKPVTSTLGHSASSCENAMSEARWSFFLVTCSFSKVTFNL